MARAARSSRRSSACWRACPARRRFACFWSITRCVRSRAIKRLTDSAALLRCLKRHGVELVLHGHDHVHSTIWIDGPSGKIPVVGVPSASALAHGHYPAAAYNLFAIERDGDAWRCEQTVRGVNEGLRMREIRQTRLI